ncbi:hypothetical protein J5N97_014058 [Dioscorea zingiberensis]|uniref:Uncharacterized protein n=1 Tax=Dioscorea zingiberensis TaxID=325984 RepID=A0A9D5CTD6_9LILI|nr:hypothetical protein J5N97_014058 [Dioscorea zingiberensis]
MIASEENRRLAVAAAKRRLGDKGGRTSWGGLEYWHGGAKAREAARRASGVFPQLDKKQKFSSDMGSRMVKRIADVLRLRNYQFPQSFPKAKDMLNKPIPHYDDLWIVCGDDHTTGDFARSIFDRFGSDDPDTEGNNETPTNELEHEPEPPVPLEPNDQWGVSKAYFIFFNCKNWTCF